MDCLIFYFLFISLSIVYLVVWQVLLTTTHSQVWARPGPLAADAKAAFPRKHLQQLFWPLHLTLYLQIFTIFHLSLCVGVCVSLSVRLCVCVSLSVCLCVCVRRFRWKFSPRLSTSHWLEAATAIRDQRTIFSVTSIS